jgi:sugar phosphate isomerase/epimerase
LKLSLSTRVAESPADKSVALMPLSEIAALAKENGYSGLSMRASQAGVHSSESELLEARRIVDAVGLQVSMVTGDVDLAVNNDQAQMSLRNITPHLDLAEAMGSRLVRVMMKSESDIAWAKRAAAEASERNITLAHQCHTRSLIETVEFGVKTLNAIDSANFGVTFEPANLMLASQPYLADAVRAFRPWIVNVYFQNHRMNPNGTHLQSTWINGLVGFDLIPLDDPSGIDFGAILEELENSDYDGWVTVHQNIADGIDVSSGVASFADHLRTLQDFSGT